MFQLDKKRVYKKYCLWHFNASDFWNSLKDKSVFSDHQDTEQNTSGLQPFPRLVNALLGTKKMEYGLHCGTLSTAGAVQAYSKFQTYNDQIFVALP